MSGVRSATRLGQSASITRPAGGRGSRAVRASTPGLGGGGIKLASQRLFLRRSGCMRGARSLSFAVEDATGTRHEWPHEPHSNNRSARSPRTIISTRTSAAL